MQEIGTTPKSLSKSSKVKKVTPAVHPSSTVVPHDITLASNELMVRFNNDRKSISISLSTVDKNSSYRDLDNTHLHGDAPGQNRAGSSVGIKYILKCIQNPDIQQKLLAISNYIETNKTIVKQEFVVIHNNFFEALNNVKENKDQEISLEKLSEFQKVINTVNSAFEKLDSPDRDSISVSEDGTLRALNQFSTDVLQMQLGLNTLTSVITNSFNVSEKWLDTVGDIDMLSKFVETAIKGGLPPKYVAHNCFLISNSSLKGNKKAGEKGSITNPIWGQTRLIFFPPTNPDIILKIALSGIGLRGNQSEIDISNRLKDDGGEQLIALVKSSSANKAVIGMEKVEVRDESHIKQSDLGRFVMLMRAFFKQRNIPLLIEDLHAGNVGFRNNAMVAIDYGILART
jgi:hypothetical protein